MSNVQQIWNQWSDTWYRMYRTDEVINRIVKHPQSVFHQTTISMINKSFPDLRGKKICVPSSGDNHAVFAFHLLGAKVTSCDISEKQIENSTNLAKERGWDIEFICDDTMHLSNINSAEYDFVYTSNGVHVWIDNLGAMYSNISRILKNDGKYIMFDIHPFSRPFSNQKEQLTVVKPYHSVGPLIIDDVPRFHWRIQDIVNAMIGAGLCVKQIEEMFAEDGSFWIDESTDDGKMWTSQELNNLCDWKLNARAALPQWLSLVASK